MITFTQDGYAAFTVSSSQTSRVVTYIRNQEAHHRKLPFRTELIRLLKKHGVAYDESFLD
jgi:putative transposase